MSNAETPPLALISLIPSFLMLAAALYISYVERVSKMITWYKIQSVFLVIVIWLAALLPHFDIMKAKIPLIFLSLIPIFLYFLIEPVLARATLIEDLGFIDRLKQVPYQIFHPHLTANIREQALITWLKPVPQRTRPILTILIELAMVFLALITAFRLESGDPTRALNLAVSFSLLAIGLSVLTFKQNIIAQIIGLLIMEHGMFLAVVQVIESSPTTYAIAIALFLYILVTLTILLFLLPDLHRLSGTIQVDEQEQLKG